MGLTFHSVISSRAFISAVPRVLPKSEDDTNFYDLVRALTRPHACARLERVAGRRRGKLDWRRQKDKDRNAAEPLSWKEVDGERKRPLERRQSSLWGNIKRAISPLQMRILCQVQGYYDAAEQAPQKQGPHRKRDRSKGDTQCPFSIQTFQMRAARFFFFPFPVSWSPRRHQNHLNSPDIIMVSSTVICLWAYQVGGKINSNHNKDV